MLPPERIGLKINRMRAIEPSSRVTPYSCGVRYVLAAADPGAGSKHL
jgi:hypothetical protein